MNTNYHVFKKGIRPEWEDAANANGGKFSIQFPRNRTGEAINDYWLNLVKLNDSKKSGMISLTMRHRFSPCWESNSSMRTRFVVLLFLCVKYFIELLSGSRVPREMKESRPLGKVSVMLAISRNCLFNPIERRRQLKEFLNLNSALVVEFTPHGDSASKTSENRFTI